MKHAEAVVAASAAAEAVYKLLAQGAPHGTWHRNLVAPANRELKLEDLVHFVQQHPGAPAEALYRFGSGRAYARMPWGSDAALAAAVEAFVAVLEKLVAGHVPRDAASPSPRPARRLETIFDDDERAPGLRDREVLRRRDAKQRAQSETRERVAEAGGGDAAEGVAAELPAYGSVPQVPPPAAAEPPARPKLTLKGKRK
jgi:hypothetical protein